MDVHKHSERVERLEIVETGRRRRWSEDEKLKIVVESFQSPRQVAATARQHGISRDCSCTNGGVRFERRRPRRRILRRDLCRRL